MSAYKDVEMINQIIDRTPVNWGIYIHIDKKSSISDKDITPRANVYKVKSIYWGGKEHLEAILLLLNKALQHNQNYDYYHIITGQDFYSTPIEEFDHILGNEQSIYIEHFTLPRKNWWNGGYDILKYRTLASICDIRRPIPRKLNHILYVIQKKFKLTRKLPKYPLYGGSIYCSLTQEAVVEVLYSPIAKDLQSRINNTTCSEEIYFQTILMNSNLKNKIRNTNLRYIDWNVKDAPKFLNLDDYQAIRNSHTLFCRKVDSKISQGLLNKLLEEDLISNKYINKI